MAGSGSAEESGADPLFLLDGTLLFFRALYGMPDVFTDGDGRSINGVRGYLAYIMRLLHGSGGNGVSDPVRRCAVAFDESLTTCWRNEHYPAYKANRAPADANIAHQLALARKVTELLGLPVLADESYEADDFIATLARLSPGAVVVVSRDKDLQQLLSEAVCLLDPKDGTFTAQGAFTEAFGFEPSLFPDYQSLTGDSVDNIPGVRGVGPKAAGRLICRFGSLEALYDAEKEWADAGVKQGSKMRERLLEERERAFLFRRILRLDDRTPLSISLEDTRLLRPKGDELRSGLRSMQLVEGLGQALIGSMEAYVG